MVISKFDLMLFSPHRKGVGFLGNIKMFHDIMVRKMMYGYAELSIMSASTVYFGDVSYTNHT